MRIVGDQPMLICGIGFCFPTIYHTASIISVIPKTQIQNSIPD